MAKNRNKKQKTPFWKKQTLTGFLVIFTVTSMLATPAVAAPPPAATTVPYTIPYSGKLFDAQGAPITTAHNIRFSLWTDADVDASDFDVDGSIKTDATGYAQWKEVHTVTPDSSGVFFVRLGSNTTLPNFTNSAHKYLQVDVKENGLPLTSYETLDPDGDTSNTADRHAINSVAFAINADTVDNADVGTGEGNLVVLDSQSRFPVSTMPGGTNVGTFVLDADDTVSSPDAIKLQFGSALEKILEYDLLNARFNFNDTVNIEQDLTVEGTINNVTINSGTVGPYNQSIVLRPSYAGAVTERDGVSNMGTLSLNFSDEDSTSGNENFNFYIWETTQTSLQDIDLVVQTNLPEGFVSWQQTPLTLSFQTETGNVIDNKIDLTMTDTSGAAVSVSGGASLAESSWTTVPMTFSGDPAFTPGGLITIHIKLSAKNTGIVHLGKLSLNYYGR